MKQNTAKNFFKEHRFIFQQSKGEKAAPTVAPTTAPPAAKPTAEKPAEAKPGETPVKPGATPEAPKTPEAPAAAKAAVTEKVETKTSSALDREKLKQEMIKEGNSQLINLLAYGPKDISPKTTVDSLIEADFKTFINQMTAELEIGFNDKLKTQQEVLKGWLEKIGGGTQEEFAKFAAANQAATFKRKLKNTLGEPAYQHLKAFAEKPENKGKDLMYTVNFDKYGTPTKIEFGPTDLMAAYDTFRAEQEKLKTPDQKIADVRLAAEALKTKEAKITTLKSYPILKFLSPFLGLDTIDAATGKSGWECAAEGTHTLAMLALDLCGYAEGNGSIEGIASFLPGQTGAKIKAAQKTLSSEKNSLSYAAYLKKNGGQPGAPAAPGAPQAPQAPNAPTKLAKGEVPTTNQEKVNMTQFGDIIAKPATMPKTGIVFDNAVKTGTGGIPDKIRIDLNKGGRLILPGNSGSDSELKIDGEKVVVPPGETRTFNSNSGKYNNGIFTLEGLINAGTVIDGAVKIKNAALEGSK